MVPGRNSNRNTCWFIFLIKQVLAGKYRWRLMIIPRLFMVIYLSRQKFPVTERVASGISTGEMYKSLANPLFIFMIICMFGTAITELFTGQWIELLLKNVTENALLILTVTTGVMVIGRAFAGPVVHKLSPQGVLLSVCNFSNYRSLYAWTYFRQYVICWRIGFWRRCLLFLAMHAWFCFRIFTKNRSSGY